MSQARPAFGSGTRTPRVWALEEKTADQDEKDNRGSSEHAVGSNLQRRIS